MTIYVATPQKTLQRR